MCVPAIARGNACERREGVHTLLVCSQREWEEEREREKEEEGGRGLVGGVRMRVHHVAMLVSSSWDNVWCSRPMWKSVQELHSPRVFFYLLCQSPLCLCHVVLADVLWVKHKQRDWAVWTMWYFSAYIRAAGILLCSSGEPGIPKQPKHTCVCRPRGVLLLSSAHALCGDIQALFFYCALC